MTRFARAKGSKASNERKEEDPTPWHIMRQQLADQPIKHNDCENQTTFVDNTTNNAAVKPVEETWIEFNEFKIKKPNFPRDIKSKTLNELSKSHDKKTGTKKTNTIKEKSNSTNFCLSDIDESKEKSKTENNDLKSKKTMLKGNKLSKPYEINKSKQDQDSTENTTLYTNKIHHNVEDASFNNDVYINKTNQKVNTKSTKIVSKTSKFKALENIKSEQEQSRPTPLEPFDISTQHIHKNKKNFTPNISENGNNEKFSLNITNDKKGFNKNYQSFSNRGSSSNVQTIIANGRKIEIVKFEAFWIKKEDLTKLKELKKKLKNQKMPNDKIKAIIKLERRKAEKALSREKTSVCYHCRKFGHKFSECPEINNSNMSKSGICFKCGSTEHTHFECKVTHSQNFRYAVCFVCNEQGHIARQCSMNPQGQYPKGGSCHLCGEVTHLRKDCPKAFEETPSSSVTVEKINSVGLEDVSEMKTNNKKQNLVKNKKFPVGGSRAHMRQCFSLFDNKPSYKRSMYFNNLPDALKREPSKTFKKNLLEWLKERLFYSERELLNWRRN